MKPILRYPDTMVATELVPRAEMEALLTAYHASHWQQYEVEDCHFPPCQRAVAALKGMS